MSTISNPITGEQYHLLGTALQRDDVWLVRHATSHRLLLVQRILHPSPAALQVLRTPDPQLPTVKSSWMENGVLTLVLERMEGTCMELLGGRVLGSRAEQQLKRLRRQVLTAVGVKQCPLNLLCLGPGGEIRLRCFPWTCAPTSPILPRVSASCAA